MTDLWNSLDDMQQTFITCGLTCFLGLILGAAWATVTVRPRRRAITDDLDVTEYAERADVREGSA